MYKIHDDIMFNTELKQKFLNVYANISTKSVYKRLFLVSKRIEEKYNKDISEFNEDQIIELLNELNPATVTASRTNINIIRYYIKFTNLKNDSMYNVLKSKNEYDFARQTDNNKKFISIKDLDELEVQIENYQDFALLRLLFEGISGKGFEEIINLKKKDVNEVLNTLKINDEYVEVSKKCVKAVGSASKETMYVKNNGNVDINTRNPELELKDSEYVFRPSIVGLGQDNSDIVTKHIITRRINILRNEFDIPELNAKNILKSGMIYEGYKLMKENDDKLTNEHLKIIAGKYKINFWWTLKEYVNSDVINDLYKEKDGVIV